MNIDNNIALLFPDQYQSCFNRIDIFHLFHGGIRIVRLMIVSYCLIHWCKR